jgi:hypothetical protein
VSIWSGYDEADIEIHGDEIEIERRLFLMDMAAEVEDVCDDCRARLVQGRDVTEDCGACDEVRAGFVR